MTGRTETSLEASLLRKSSEVTSLQRRHFGSTSPSSLLRVAVGRHLHPRPMALAVGRHNAPLHLAHHRSRRGHRSLPSLLQSTRNLGSARQWFFATAETSDTQYAAGCGLSAVASGKHPWSGVSGPAKPYRCESVSPSAGARQFWAASSGNTWCSERVTISCFCSCA